MLRRRTMIAKAQEVEEMLEYVGDISVQNKWGGLAVKINAENDTLYLLLPKTNKYIKSIIINVYRNKYGYLACSESTTAGAIVASNYTLSDNAVDFSLRIGESKVETIDFEVYKRSL